MITIGDSDTRAKDADSGKGENSSSSTNNATVTYEDMRKMKEKIYRLNSYKDIGIDGSEAEILEYLNEEAKGR